MSQAEQVSQKQKGASRTKMIGTTLFFLASMFAIAKYGQFGSGEPRHQNPSIKARMACIQALTVSARYPDSVSFSLISDPPQIERMSDGAYQIRADYTAKNGLGNTVSLAGHCTVKNGVAYNIESDPR